MWFFESEDTLISEIVEKLSSTTGDDNKVFFYIFFFSLNLFFLKILNQVKLLITELCNSKKIEIPNLNTLNYLTVSKSISNQVSFFCLLITFYKNNNKILYFKSNDSGHVSLYNSDNEFENQIEEEVNSNINKSEK
jgi:hypothetical protein